MSITSLTTGEPTPLGRPWGLGVGGDTQPSLPSGALQILLRRSWSWREQPWLLLPTPAVRAQQ